MTIPFWKMHGAGNDFVVVDDRQQTFPINETGWLQKTANRKTGVGCDGFILIQAPQANGSDFRMRFINPDGGEVEMCGNGARCVARVAQKLDIVDRAMAFETLAGMLRAEVRDDDTVCLHMTDPYDWCCNQTLSLDDTTIDYDFVNTGVPHVVERVDDTNEIDVLQRGAAVRYHNAFQPGGTNTNFISCDSASALRIRTYERGVEDETLACGTGMVAAALVAAKRGWVEPPVMLTCASSDRVFVDFELTDDSARNVTLTGPAVFVFEGTISYA
jgi:diaminopimelate epimerase